MADPESPQFRVPDEGEPIPVVDPEDLKLSWRTKPGDKEALLAASQKQIAQRSRNAKQVGTAVKPTVQRSTGTNA